MKKIFLPLIVAISYLFPVYSHAETTYVESDWDTNKSRLVGVTGLQDISGELEGMFLFQGDRIYFQSNGQTILVGTSTLLYSPDEDLSCGFLDIKKVKFEPYVQETKTTPLRLNLLVSMETLVSKATEDYERTIQKYRETEAKIKSLAGRKFHVVKGAVGIPFKKITVNEVIYRGGRYLLETYSDRTHFEFSAVGSRPERFEFEVRVHPDGQVSLLYHNLGSRSDTKIESTPFDPEATEISIGMKYSYRSLWLAGLRTSVSAQYACGASLSAQSQVVLAGADAP